MNNKLKMLSSFGLLAAASVVTFNSAKAEIAKPQSCEGLVRRIEIETLMDRVGAQDSLLILDVSGSMYDQFVKQQNEAFLAKLNARAIIAFANYAIAIEPKSGKSTINAGDVFQDLNGLYRRKVGQSTNYAAAVSKLAEYLEKSKTTYKNIVWLTDGLPNRPLSHGQTQRMKELASKYAGKLYFIDWTRDGLVPSPFEGAERITLGQLQSDSKTEISRNGTLHIVTIQRPDKSECKIKGIVSGLEDDAAADIARINEALREGEPGSTVYYDAGSGMVKEMTYKAGVITFYPEKYCEPEYANGWVISDHKIEPITSENKTSCTIKGKLVATRSTQMGNRFLKFDATDKSP